MDPRYVQTFFKEGRKHEAVAYTWHSIEEQEDKHDTPVGSIQHSTLRGLHEEQDRHEDHTDQQHDEGFQEPGSPVEPVAQTHDFHVFLGDKIR